MDPPVRQIPVIKVPFGHQRVHTPHWAIQADHPACAYWYWRHSYYVSERGRAIGQLWTAIRTIAQAVTLTLYTNTSAVGLNTALASSAQSQSWLHLYQESPDT